MTEKRHAADKSDKKADKGDEPKEESHVLKGIWGKVKHAGGVAVDKAQDLGEDAVDGVKKHGPKVVQGAKDAINSPTGQKIKGAGENIVREEIQHGKTVARAAQNGDYRTVAKEAAPLIIGGPAGYIGKEVAGKVMNEAVRQVPAEHQGTAKQVQKGLQLKDAVTGNGFPSGQGLIIDAATDLHKQQKAVELGKQAVGGISKFWHKMTASDADKKVDKNDDKKDEHYHEATPTKSKSKR